LIPGFDGAVFSQEWKDALWARFSTGAPPRRRRSVAQSSIASEPEDLARRYGVNPKTIAKWRRRTSVADLPIGPRDAHSSTLSPEQEAIIVAFRRHTLLPLV
jgi:transposase-like protein